MENIGLDLHQRETHRISGRVRLLPERESKARSGVGGRAEAASGAGVASASNRAEESEVSSARLPAEGSFSKQGTPSGRSRVGVGDLTVP